MINVAAINISYVLSFYLVPVTALFLISLLILDLRPFLSSQFPISLDRKLVADSDNAYAVPGQPRGIR